ncbi:hypothetical protein [Falsiroseomonas oryziterrae]|uniref:hypothetical protein n=1 Tax=Falsiroseomonas oryziterrae TaxID=2911368 RepID=UPI001F32BB49|nr:hypothetical protein [Roseomonas sp. NPKOSM-4]
MDEKARLRRFAYGMGATVVLTILAGIFFGTLGVTMALMLGLLVTLLAGGGLGRKN